MLCPTRVPQKDYLYPSLRLFFQHLIGVKDYLSLHTKQNAVQNV